MIDADLGKATDAEAKARAEAKAIKAPDAEVHAAGGPIFRKKGTDTVPAMLTPNEFVVNAKSAKANQGLLHQINNANGPVYLANGGRVQDEDLFGNVERIVDRRLENRDFSRLTPEEIGWTRKFEEKKLAKQQQEAYLRANNFFRKPPTSGLAAVAQQGIAAKNSIPDSTFVPDFQKDIRINEIMSKLDLRHLTPEQVEWTRRFQERKLAKQNKAALAKQQRAEYGVGQTLVNAQYANDNSYVGYLQAIGRGGLDLPGEEGQLRAASGSIASQRKFDEEAFLHTFGEKTYNQRLAQTTSFATKGFANGGMVDNVPAMLSEGEFVFSKKAVNNIGAGNVVKLHHFANGGLVPGGGGSDGQTGAGLGFGMDSESKSVLQAFNESMKSFAGPAQQLSSSLDKFASLVEKIPSEMELTGNFTTNVNINGAEAFQGMEGKFKEMMVSYVTTEVERQFKRKLPDATR